MAKIDLSKKKKKKGPQHKANVRFEIYIQVRWESD